MGLETCTPENGKLVYSEGFTQETVWATTEHRAVSALTSSSHG